MTTHSINAPRRTVVIESVAPAVDGGRYPVKREVGAVLEVSADIFKDGHDALVAYLRYRRDGDRAWRESPMHHVDNDRWAGTFTLAAIGRYRYTIEALTEPFRSWLADLEKRHAGGQDLESALARFWPPARRFSRSATQERNGSGSASIVKRYRPVAASVKAPAQRSLSTWRIGASRHSSSPSRR